MSDLAKLLQQRAELEREIARIQIESRAKVVADIHALMNAHGLTLADLATPARKAPGPKRAGTAVAAKYRDQVGNHWSGRGLKPKWLTAALAAGATLQDFAV